jgi:hypothetical protein
VAQALRRVIAQLSQLSKLVSLLTPSAKVLPFKRSASPGAATRATPVADGLDGPPSVRKWDRRTLVTLVLLTALIAGAAVGLSKFVGKSATVAPTHASH